MCINFIPIHQDTHTNHALFTLQLWFDLFSDKNFLVHIYYRATYFKQSIHKHFSRTVSLQLAHTHATESFYPVGNVLVHIRKQYQHTMKLYITHMYIHVYVRTYVNMYVHMYVRTYVCMYICLYVCIYVCTYVYALCFCVLILQVVAGNIDFSGPVKFVDNDAETFDGGAVYLLSFSQLTLHPGASLDFTNNAGRYKTTYVSTYIQVKLTR